MASNARSLGRLISKCVAHSLACWCSGVCPPYSRGRKEMSGNFLYSFTMSPCTQNRFLILSLNKVLANSKTAHTPNGKERRFISRCLIGRFFSQHENILATSEGVQIPKWPRLIPEQSKM